MQKEESKWRSKLIKRFQARFPKGFIWAHDAHFRHGFPDLTMIFPSSNPLEPIKTVHTELKIDRRPHHPMNGVSPRQKVVLEQIARAGGTALVLTHYPEDKQTAYCDIGEEMIYLCTDEQLENRLWGFKA